MGMFAHTTIIKYLVQAIDWSTIHIYVHINMYVHKNLYIYTNCNHPSFVDESTHQSYEYTYIHILHMIARAFVCTHVWLIAQK